MIERKELLKKAGQMVIVHYAGFDSEECFVIGWFFSLTENEVFLKITSTKFETYESRSVHIDQVTKIESYELN